MQKFFFDLFPIILFFAVFKLYGIYIATASAIVATFAQIGWVWVRHRKVGATLWMSLAVITIFGGATLLLHDETFIKWKPTVLYWLFASTLLVSQIIFKKNLMVTMMGGQISLPPHVWFRLNISWALFFTLLGGANLYVATTYSTSQWVNFKLFGTLGLMVVFIIIQGLVLSKYIDQEEPD